MRSEKGYLLLGSLPDRPQSIGLLPAYRYEVLGHIISASGSTDPLRASAQLSIVARNQSGCSASLMVRKTCLQIQNPHLDLPQASSAAKRIIGISCPDVATTISQLANRTQMIARIKISASRRPLSTFIP